MKIDEEIAKAKAIEKVYMEEENTAASVASMPAKSNNSQISRVSRRSSTAQKVKVFGLEAEREAKIKTQEAEIEIQRIKEKHGIELNRRLKIAKQNVDVLKLAEQSAEQWLKRGQLNSISTMTMSKQTKSQV